MRIPIAEAEGRLAELLRLAETGEEVILTSEGKPAARVVPVKPVEPEKAASEVAAPLDASEAEEFLYNERGLPA